MSHYISLLIHARDSKFSTCHMGSFCYVCYLVVTLCLTSIHITLLTNFPVMFFNSTWGSYIYIYILLRKKFSKKPFHHLEIVLALSARSMRRLNSHIILSGNEKPYPLTDVVFFMTLFLQT